MEITFQFFADPGKATAFALLDLIELANGATSPVDAPVYLGSHTAGVVLERATNPGADPLQVALIGGDANLQTTDFKLALTQGGLDTATAGEPLDLGLVLPSSGVAVFWVRLQSGITVPGLYSAVSLQMADLSERLA